MKSQALTQFPHPDLIAYAMFIFLLIFFGALVWTMRSSHREEYKRLANLPFEEDNFDE